VTLMPRQAASKPDRSQVVAVSTSISRGYRSYVLGLLVVVNVFNFIDRQILSILLQPIKNDLGLSDTALGFLSIRPERSGAKSKNDLWCRRPRLPCSEPARGRHHKN
jgi:hypothetical protein